MKNFYTLITTLIICGSAFAQGTIANMQAAPKKISDRNINKVINQAGIIYTAKSSVDCSTSSALYCEDFEGVTAPALPGTLTTSSTESGYVIPMSDGTTESVTGFFTGNAADAGLGGYWTYLDEHTQFAMTNDDSCLPSGATPNNDNNCDLSFETLTLPTWDFTNQVGQWLQFEFYHDMNWGGGDANVEVSIDGGQNWDPLNGNPLPATQAWQAGAFDLSQLEGQASVTIRFTWSDNGTWASGFCIDDIVVDPLPDYGIAMLDYFQRNPSPYFGGTSYNTVPLAQAQASFYAFGGYLKNMGLNQLDSTKIHASIASESFTTNSWGTNLLTLAQDTFFGNDVFVPTSAGTYTVEMYGADTNGTTTDTESIDFVVSDYDYARDEWDFIGDYTSRSSLNSAGAEQRGNVYDIHADGMLYAIKAAFNPTTTPDARAKAILNSVDPASGDVTYLTETEEIKVGAFADNNWINFMFSSPIPVMAGDVLLATISAEYNGSDTVWINNCGSSDPQESLLQDIDGVDGDAGTWYYTTVTPMVRLNFDPSAEGVSITEEELKLSSFALYPNPSNGLFTMNITTKESTDFTMTINNIIGQTISSEELNNVTALSKNIDLTELGQGVYFMTLSGENGTITKQIVVK